MSELLKRIALMPGRIARGAWRFIEPPLKVGRIPLARTVLVMQAIAALVFLGYTLVKKDVRLPFSSEPYMVQVLLADAKGLNPAKEPAAGVAGVQAGRVVEAEVADNGEALVTLRLDPEMRGKIFADATVFVRPTSVLQTLIVNIQPGDPAAGPLPEGEPIDAAHTEAFVHIDELTGMLNADTQAQAQVLISEAAKALRGREPELRAIVAELGRTVDAATPLAEALADRRRLLTRLAGHLEALFETLGDRGAQLASAIAAGRETLETTAARQPELAEATLGLAPALAEATRALQSTRELTEPLVPALDTLTGAAGSVEPAAAGLRDLAPRLDEFVGLADRLVDDGAKPARLLADGLVGLSGRVRNDQVPALEELVDLVDLLAEYRNGLIQFSEVMSGAISHSRNGGPYVQYAIINSELNPDGFGLSPAAARRRAGSRGHTRLALMLAEALEHTCKDSNPGACLLRFGLPGLPEDPLVARGREG